MPRQPRKLTRPPSGKAAKEPQTEALVRPSPGSHVTEVLRFRCPVCVTPDTMIFTGSYCKPVTDIRLGDETAAGTVLARSHRELWRSPIIRLKPRYLPAVCLTPDHLVLIARVKRSTKPNYNFVIAKPLRWKPAQDILPTGGKRQSFDCVVIPKASGNQNPPIPQLRPFIPLKAMRLKPFIKDMRPFYNQLSALLGWYVAEGHVMSKGVVFSLGKHEKSRHQEICQLIQAIGFKPATRERPTATQIELPSRILSRAFAAWCGKGARNKQIPDFIMQGTLDKRIFFDAYISGDGHQSQLNGRPYISMSTSSEQLANQLQMLAFSIGLTLGISGRERTNSCINDRTIEGHTFYVLQGHSDGEQGRFHRCFQDKRNWYIPVVECSQHEYSGPIYNLQTTSGVFQVPFVIHNCGMMPTANRLEQAPYELALFLQRFGGRLPNSKTGYMEYVPLTDAAEIETFLELELQPVMVRLREQFPSLFPILPVAEKKGKTKAKIPIATTPEVETSIEELTEKTEESIGALQAIDMDETKKAASIKKLEKILAGLETELIAGISELEEAIEAYKEIQREGMTPEDYASEKETAFEAITEALEALEADTDAIEDQADTDSS